jgi:hypothetical protein
MSVYRQSPNTDGDLMYERSDIGALLELAHRYGIEIKVWTAYGDHDWPELCVDPDCACRESCWVWDRVEEYARFNDDPRYQEFDGFMLDVEPAEPDARLLGLYDCTRQRLPAGTEIGAVLRFWWHPPHEGMEEITYPCGTGTTAPLYVHALETLVLDRVVMLCYRDFAEGPDGIVDACDEEAGFAFESGRIDALEIGIETQCHESLTDRETFCQEGAAAMHCQLDAVRRNLRFGGFAMNYYGSCLLSGSDIWPAYDTDGCRVRSLAVDLDETTDETVISWPGALPAVSYDVVRGELSELSSGDLGTVDLIASETTETAVIDNCPYPGTPVYYLQRLRTEHGEGNLGNSSSCDLRTPVQEILCP